VAAALLFRWDGRKTRLFFRTKPESYDTPSLIAFLQDLRRQTGGRRCILIWDGLAAHKSRPMRAFLEGQRDWLSVERLPGYAPDLNPVEPLWGNVKGRELANRCAENLAEARRALRRGMSRVRSHPTLAAAFLHHAGLFF